MTTSKLNDKAKMNSVDAPAAEGEVTAAVGVKKAYAPPTVKALGNVAELTFGPAGTQSDGGGGKVFSGTGH